MPELASTSPLAHRRVDGAPAILRTGALMLRECCDVTLGTLTVDCDRRPNLRAGLEAVIGQALPTAVRPAGSDPVLIWQSPVDLLLIGKPDCVAALIPRFAEALADAPALIEPGTAGLVMIELSGPGAAILCPLPVDGPLGMLRSAVTRIGDLRVTMLHHAGLEERIGLIVERPSADTLWAWLARRMDIAQSA